MKKICKKYLSVFRLRFQIEMTYRAAALGGLVCQLFFALIYIVLYKTLNDGAPMAAPFRDTVVYVWIQQACFRMLLSKDEDLFNAVRTGAVAYELCRPVNAYGYYYMRSSAQKLCGMGLRAVPMLLIAFLLPEPYNMALPSDFVHLTLFLMSLFLGLVNTCALDSIAMAFTLRSIDNRGITSMFSMLMMTFSGNVLPLTLFPDRWQTFIRFTPYAQLIDAPVRIYTGAYTLLQAAQTFLIQGLWAAVLISLGMMFWNSSFKRLEIQGG